MTQGFGGPFGAVVVRGDEILAEGWNQVTSSHDPTAHAEITAIRAACRSIGNFSLAGCEIYSSCEPCPMCLSAIYWARLEGIYYAASRQDAAAIGFDDDFLYGELGRDPATRKLPTRQALQGAAAAVMQGWLQLPAQRRY
jgi:tRNA(Arg) A34 adenosine deaminase TadA